MTRPIGIEVLAAHYKAGIGVAAATLGVRIRTLGMDYDAGARFGFSLEPLSSWIGKKPESLAHRVSLIEDYIVVCLSGDAARFICASTRRPHLRRSSAGAGPELKQLRLLWECLEPESERALVIALGTLPVLDEGDPEATIYRLWKRAHRLLRESRQRIQLAELARHLLRNKQMSGAEVEDFLKHVQ